MPATVAIVGAGLVGALNAVYFAQRGWHVDLYELRPGKWWLTIHPMAPMLTQERL